jgi:plastocyanin
MDELTARLQRAATEVAERAVVPDPDDLVRRGRRQRRRQVAGAVLVAMAVAGGVVAVALLRPWQPAAPTGMQPATPSTWTLAPGHRCPARATTTARLTANNLAFDPTCLAVVAGRPFTLSFDNQDRVPHNLAVFRGSNAEGASVFRGLVFRGPRVVEQRLPALRAGDYLFHCDVHPHAMQGKLVVR